VPRRVTEMESRREVRAGRVVIVVVEVERRW
jgi:hypothetical protein